MPSQRRLQVPIASPGRVQASEALHMARQAASLDGKVGEPSLYKILIVDDHEDSALLAQYAVETMGHQGIPISSGHEAVPMALSVIPDIILLDIWLDNISGIEILRRLKQHACTTSIPVIAMTALTMPEEVNQIKAAGFSGYLAKPYLLEDLFNEVTACLPNKVSSRAPNRAIDESVRHTAGEEIL